MNKYKLRQIELVEFGERVYHLGLRHKGINGSLYEDILIKYLREDIPEFTFFKGQLKSDEKISPQYDILICKKETKQPEFLTEISNIISVINPNDCLAVIELKKYANPKMICQDGAINSAYSNFKTSFPKLNYLFVCFRFKERKNKIEKNWESLKEELNVDEKFCFWGNIHKKDKEWEFPWINNTTLIQRNSKFLDEYERLVKYIKQLQTLNPHP